MVMPILLDALVAPACPTPMDVFVRTRWLLLRLLMGPLFSLPLSTSGMLAMVRGRFSLGSIAITSTSRTTSVISSERLNCTLRRGGGGSSSSRVRSRKTR